MADQKTIDDYIKTFPEDLQEMLEKVHKTIRKALPDAEETLSYGIPTFKIDGKYAVYFSGWKHHISLYPRPHDDSLAEAMAPYVSGKGTLQFPFDKPIPYELIKKISIVLAEESRKRND
jgi:uncharacterized protein YdhG (YjbR/CyaY superfamily)